MIRYSPKHRVFLCTRIVDGRKSIDGLVDVVRGIFNEEPYSETVFVFPMKRRNCVKVLWWDRNGFVLIYKRLESGKFSFGLSAAGMVDGTLSQSDLDRLLSGPTDHRDLLSHHFQY
jgi:transposase